MKKRRNKSLLLILFILFLFTENISAETDEYEEYTDESYISTVSGSNESYVYNLVFASFNVNGKHHLDNISGEIRYDSSTLILYKIYPSDYLPNWKFDFDTSKIGRIIFHGQSSNSQSESSLINDDTVLFNMTFIVHLTTDRSTEIKAENVYTEYITISTDENNCINIDEINEALANGEEPPAPIFGDLKKHTRIHFMNQSNTVRISTRQSNNCYLKSAEFEQGDVYPVFSKLTTSYKVTIDSKTPLKFDFKPEDSRSSIEVSDEKNNQIVVSVTAEDGSTNSYVFTIVRKNDYSSTDNPKQDPTNPDNPNNPVTPDAKENGSMKILLYGAGFISAAIIAIGFYFVYQGSHRIIYAENE